MTEHLPECPILKPCCDDEEFPEHGFCGNFVGRCLHCMAECICDALRSCEARVTAATVQRVEALTWSFIHSSGELITRAEAVAAIKGSTGVMTAIKGDQ